MTAKTATTTVGILKEYAPFLLPLIIVCAGMFIISVDTDSASNKLCDKAVEALLHSTDLVEVTRAKTIIEQIPCSIRRRLMLVQY